MSLKIFKNNVGRICAWVNKFESLLYFLANIRENLLIVRKKYLHRNARKIFISLAQHKGWTALVSPHVRESRTVLDSGFHAVDSGLRVLDSGFQHSGFRIPKRAGFHFFTGFNAFLRTSFSCSNLAILKDPGIKFSRRS